MDIMYLRMAVTQHPSQIRGFDVHELLYAGDSIYLTLEPLAVRKEEGGVEKS